MTMTEIPTAIHRGDDELPWVDIGEGSLLKVLQIKEREGLWVIRNRFMPGYQVQTHKHTGPVYAFTTTGAWRYKESGWVARGGDTLYEVAGSSHTPESFEDTEIFFVMVGELLFLDQDNKNTVATASIASLLFNQKKLDDAATWYKKLIQLDPKNTLNPGRYVGGI